MGSWYYIAQWICIGIIVYGVIIAISDYSKSRKNAK
jgi:hypothetical protein